MSKKNVRLITLLTVIFVIVSGILLFTGPRMKNQVSIRTFKAMPSLPAPGTVSLYSPGNNTIKNFPTINGVNLKKGKVYYNYYCVFCHGNDGKGNGQVGISYIPKPADLTTDSIRNFTNEHLLWAIINGTGHAPVLDRVISPEYRGFIVLYVKNGIK